MLPYHHTCSTDNLARLLPPVATALSTVAAAYKERTGQTITVTSAWRSLRHCAELMAGFNREQLEAMYCRNGYPEYIRQMVEAAEQKQAPLNTEETYQILCRRQQGYISYHLLGAAVDIATKDLTEQKLLVEMLTDAGFVVSDETSLGIPCLHAAYSKISPPLPVIKK